MKATGMVRRIDDLGRVVIPKEIRRTLRIREGDPLEIFTDREGEIILKKYSPISELGTVAKEYAEILSAVMKHGILITDRDQILAVAGEVKKDTAGQTISQEMGDIIQSREKVIAVKDEDEYITVTDGLMEEYNSEIIWPILLNSEAIGSVVFLSKEGMDSMGETEQALAQCAAEFLVQGLSIS